MSLQTATPGRTAPMRDVYMTTYPHGLHFHHFDPQSDQIHIEDIAYQLSNNCRYNGAVPYHYSVAYHSLLCLRYYRKHADRPSKIMQRTILLHDAAEAYWPDMHSMAKRHIPTYMKFLRVAEVLIAQKYRCHYPEPPEVKWIDSVLISTEMVKLKGEPPYRAEPDMVITFRKRNPASVRREFLEEWDTIKP